MKNKFIDTDDLKIKHLSGEYVNTPNVPEVDDLLFYLHINNKKFVLKSDIVKFFGIEKSEKIDEILFLLREENIIGINGDKVNL